MLNSTKFQYFVWFLEEKKKKFEGHPHFKNAEAQNQRFFGHSVDNITKSNIFFFPDNICFLKRFRYHVHVTCFQQFMRSRKRFLLLLDIPIIIKWWISRAIKWWISRGPRIAIFWNISQHLHPQLMFLGRLILRGRERVTALLEKTMKKWVLVGIKRPKSPFFFYSQKVYDCLRDPPSSRKRFFFFQIYWTIHMNEINEICHIGISRFFVF